VFKPVGPLLNAVLPALLARAPLTPEKVEFAWRTVAGDALARVTRVRLADGVLHVKSDDPRWLAEVTRARGGLLPRLATLLGDGVVRIIRTET
jgi:predicted nucleic acid-binding Zn ribbon protein